MDKIFKLEKVKPNIEEFSKIGFDKCYLEKGLEKHNFITVKVYELNCAQANILKQTAISCGTDCAVHRETITGRVEKSDCILSGSFSQIRKISEKLKYQPFKLSSLGNEILNLVFEKSQPKIIRGKTFNWAEKTYIMGIVNVTPDSFSDGGLYLTPENAVKHALKLINDGADIIDIGGESTRPYSESVSPEEELKRIKPVIEGIRNLNNEVPISIDTRNALTAEEALKSGADIINDVSGCDWDSEMINVLKKFQVPYVLTHSKGTPDIMQNDTSYEDVVDDICNFFSSKLKEFKAFGIETGNVILDAGIGFGKTKEQNYEILRKTDSFKSFGLPLLMGYSRKTFLKDTINTTDNEKLDTAGNAVSSYLIQKGVSILRVHNVSSLNNIRKVYQNLIC